MTATIQRLKIDKQLASIKDCIQKGIPLNMIQCTLLLMFLGKNFKGMDRYDIIYNLRNLNTDSTFLNDPDVQNVFTVIDQKIQNTEKVIPINTNVTLLFGDPINVIIGGKVTDKNYSAEVIGVVTNMVTGNSKILAKKDELISHGVSSDRVSCFQCLFDTNDVKLINEVLDSTFSSDKYKSTIRYDDIDDLLTSLENSNEDFEGFIIRTSSRIIAVYIITDLVTGEPSYVVKEIHDGKIFNEDANILHAIFN